MAIPRGTEIAEALNALQMAEELLIKAGKADESRIVVQCFNTLEYRLGLRQYKKLEPLPIERP